MVENTGPIRTRSLSSTTLMVLHEDRVESKTLPEYATVPSPEKGMR